MKNYQVPDSLFDLRTGHGGHEGGARADDDPADRRARQDRRRARAHALAGRADYYRVGAGHRYLAVRGGVLSTSSPHHFHEWRWVNAALTELVWLARLTGRVLVWPRIFDFQQYHHAADHVDLRSVEAVLGGWRSWRESTFFANPRLDVGR